ncbi:chemotaxis protein CheA [Emcibacter nanhaiensis]|uniref:Chemotaxis protein CheA n=1 Tax=Emcibacter nanhaiensis TaxID=1505037 RepID=A0A501PLC6_9PROT|nr:chemotaxis protein CheA [Emcibacter nanhaiensis]TPD60734.1 chemotaxis protein CheA [Emcibacter nanhaiensis]
MTTPDPTEVFLQEARELLDTLEQALLDLEQSPDNRDLVDSAFRALHTIKGSGSMFGFDDVAGFVHEFETAFDRVRKGEVAPSAGLIAVALSAKDHVHRLIEEPDRHVAAGEPILKALRQIVECGNEEEISEDIAAEQPGEMETGLQTWHIVFRLPADALALGTDPLLLLDELRELGSCEIMALTDGVPLLDEIDPEICHLAWDVTLTTSQPRQAIEDVFMFILDDMELTIEHVTGQETSLGAGEGQVMRDDAATAEVAQANAALRKEGSNGAVEKTVSSLRVPAERLDELMDRVGELVIAQARLSQIAVTSEDLTLKAVAEELERLSSGLRDTTMGIRMVPIGTLFGRFKRLIFDLSRELDKEIEFLTSGEETELDKTVIERLADPLVHIIRNAVDHGLEAPEKRTQAGKAARGTVRLAAVHSGAEVAISIIDDGAGLDAARIRAKAVDAGLIEEDAQIPDQELYQYIFHPGFSTAAEVTSLSGRGVGMDVVKRTMDALRGSIDVASTPGEGTTVTLRLPLTLAIIDGMLVRVGNARYSIPLSTVEECVELPASAEAGDTGRNFLNIRGSLVPFLRLRELFNVDVPPDLHQKVVVVSSGDFRVGLVVDQIIENSQTVIKSLSKFHADVETFSGATILGDGTVALILDVGHLVSFGQTFESRFRTDNAGRAA